MASAATEVGGSQAKERVRCPTCGGELQERGKHVRKLTTHGQQTVRQVTEQAGAVQVRLQGEQVATVLRERPESPAGPTLQLMSLDG